jgi:hypothetical protein
MIFCLMGMPARGASMTPVVIMRKEVCINPVAAPTRSCQGKSRKARRDDEGQAQSGLVTHAETGCFGEPHSRPGAGAAAGIRARSAGAAAAELAVRFTDEEKYFVSEASDYRLLKAHDLVASPAFIVVKAAEAFAEQTTAPNRLWQTDFTYLKVIGWGWFYLLTTIRPVRPAWRSIVSVQAPRGGAC